jgi:hypothetical protein
MEPDSSTGAVGPPLAELPSHGYFGLTFTPDVSLPRAHQDARASPGLTSREPEGGIVHQQPPRRLSWGALSGLQLLDDDFDSSISPLEQKPSSAFQHAHRLPERGLFVGKDMTPNWHTIASKAASSKGDPSAPACCHLTVPNRCEIEHGRVFPDPSQPGFLS